MQRCFFLAGVVVRSLWWSRLDYGDDAPTLSRVLCASESRCLLPLNAKDPRCSKGAIELRLRGWEELIRPPFWRLECAADKKKNPIGHWLICARLWLPQCRLLLPQPPFHWNDSGFAPTTLLTGPPPSVTSPDQPLDASRWLRWRWAGMTTVEATAQRSLRASSRSHLLSVQFALSAHAPPD